MSAAFLSAARAAIVAASCSGVIGRTPGNGERREPDHRFELVPGRQSEGDVAPEDEGQIVVDKVFPGTPATFKIDIPSAALWPARIDASKHSGTRAQTD